MSDKEEKESIRFFPELELTIQLRSGQMSDIDLRKLLQVITTSVSSSLGNDLNLTSKVERSALVGKKVVHTFSRIYHPK